MNESALDFIYTIIGTILILLSVTTLRRKYRNGSIAAKYASEFLAEAEKLEEEKKPTIETKKRSTSVIEMMLSKRAEKFGVAYVLLTAALSLHFYFYPENIGVLTLITILILSFFINQKSTEYRVRKGIYGTARNEATEIIEYILAHSTDKDFPGGGRKIGPLPSEKTKKPVEGLGGFERA